MRAQCKVVGNTVHLAGTVQCGVLPHAVHVAVSRSFFERWLACAQSGDSHCFGDATGVDTDVFATLPAACRPTSTAYTPTVELISEQPLVVRPLIEYMIAQIHHGSSLSPHSDGQQP